MENKIDDYKLFISGIIGGPYNNYPSSKINELMPDFVQSLSDKVLREDSLDEFAEFMFSKRSYFNNESYQLLVNGLSKPLVDSMLNLYLDELGVKNNKYTEMELYKIMGKYHKTCSFGMEAMIGSFIGSFIFGSSAFCYSTYLIINNAEFNTIEQLPSLLGVLGALTLPFITALIIDSYNEFQEFREHDAKEKRGLAKEALELMQKFK